MSKTKSVLLLIAALLFAVPVYAQSTSNITFKITVVDKDLNLKNVPKFALVIRSTAERTLFERRIATSFEGTASISLPSGQYVVISENALAFEGKSFSWEKAFAVEEGKPVTVELSNDNAKIAYATDEPAGTAPRRSVSAAGELFKTLRDGVVTIEGELGSGTGFIFDEKGLVLTNQHVIDQSNEIRVRFDRYTAVKARLIAEDVERDIAILQINLSAFPKARVLKIADGNSHEPNVVEGEHVFTIGSPLYQDKILTTGVASKIEARAIISDINFNSGNSGGPLFNSIGEVVGLTTFTVKSDVGSAFSGTVTGEEGSGLAGIVRIEEAAAIVAKAREIAVKKGLPSAELMPNVPDGTFPVEAIKTALSAKDFPTKQYVTDVKDYQIKYMTPVYKFYAIEKDRIESLRNREKRNADKGITETTDMMFRDLRYWNEYAGELRPVVDILALPETGATGKSLFLSAVTNATIGYGTPLEHKYKADFYQMKLMCDGKEVTPVRRNKTEIERGLQSYYKSKKRYTYAGVYSYPHDVFAPGRCKNMQLQVFSEEDIEKPITTSVTEEVKKRVWADFQEFRSQAGAGRQ